MSLAQGKTAAESVIRHLEEGVPAGSRGFDIAGSIRRGEGVVGDIDLIAPLPAPESGGGGDELLSAIRAKFDPPAAAGGLFDACRATLSQGKIGRQVKGVHPWFRYCALAGAFGPAGHGGATIELRIEIHRYTPGPLGNRGWIEIMRTGPAGFGQWFLSQWKMKWRTPGAASEHGYLLDGVGVAVPTPTEAEAFTLCGLRYIPPERRGTVIARAAV